MNKFFGTDGVRGVAGSELTCELAMNIGRAAGSVLSEYYHQKPVFIIGKDTRISSDMLESALAAGLCSVGASVISLGVVPTPAVAVLINKYNASAGFMISASHNPFEYNGIKIFNKDGYKLPDEIETRIEEKIRDIIKSKNNNLDFNLKQDSEFGKVSASFDSIDEYINYIKSSIDLNNLDFKNLKIAIDCANGSASATAKKLFDSLKIDYLIINDKPNGLNINNNCGSTHIENLCDFVIKNKCDVGFAFDGDADRCLIVDEKGQVIDGDKIIAIMSKYLKDKDLLAKNTIVVTVMSNLGLFKMAKKNNIKVETTKVGDRYVLEKMKENGYCIGGEASGHIILLDYSTTGDGQLVAVNFLKILKGLDQKVSELASIMTTCPQVLINVKVKNAEKYNILEDNVILERIKEFEKELGDNGRILLRPSGTEPLLRVMTEGVDENQIKKIANELSNLVQERFGI
ncbi:MAG: phosphoglucosamine mutase [Oscillospiraceae bacterium]|nr:phosphoglucosamine mutase [Oscillospiraceae bacterium]